ncbi:replication factor RFC1 domain protein [Dictyocaulus viviparus]|uniref:Replication factor RFC1 domain protein n=1 Tax=Dictyocaulus viviparus TaxID=29172 RepID=A0A0D8Y9E2_DICVI|nr:replication factor RFC1 domain protein [Dictyocaulus viviparus]
MVEMNASDVRSKKSLEQRITQLTESHQIEEYFTAVHRNNDENEVKHVLIMDEVDGMSGTEDRAGISELIQIIKETKIPIICICNDRQHPKIRSLANYCFDIRFQKPRVEQIRARLMSIACQEKVKVSKEEMDQMIELSGHDVRQSIYNLQLFSSAGGQAKVQKKDMAVGPFEAARKLLDSRSTLQEKQDMFFVDYGIMPLFVQENYPNMRNDKHTAKQAIAGLRKAADLISHGDIIERCIRSTGTWKLLNEQAIIGCALPSIAVDGHLRAMIQFPSWLGKNSTANKRQRIMRQLATHAHLKMSADIPYVVVDYVPVLHDCLTKPLLEREADGVFEVVCIMNDYCLVREDNEAISELAVWPGKVDPSSKILPKVKAALTRALNKEHRSLPYPTGDVAKGRKKTLFDYEVEMDEDGNLIEKMDEESGFEDDSDDEDYKPGAKSKTKARSSTSTASRGRGRGSCATGPQRGSFKRKK